MPKSFQNVSIILPAVNETLSFRRTVDILLETCAREDICELFIVLCKKTTPECVKTAEQIRDSVRDIPVTIYYQEKPFVGAAFQEAFERVSGSHLIVISTDLETPPVLVKDFIAMEKQNPEGIVTASRWIGGGSFAGYNKIKQVLNFVFQKMMGLLFHCDNTDLTYGFRIFPTDLMRSIRWEESKHPFFLETALKPLRLGVRLREIPAQWEARTEGESQNSFFKNFAYFKTAFHVRFMKKSEILKSREEGEPSCEIESGR